MSNLSDLFVSYKAISEPEITVPKYNFEMPLQNFEVPASIQEKVDNVKARMESPTFKWSSGGTKEAPYNIIHSKQSDTQNSQNFSSAPSPYEGNSWKSQMLEAYKRAGCSEQYAKNLVGQDALESGWGKHAVGNFNYGNIKAGSQWKGTSKQAYDKKENSNHSYRNYNSIDDYVQDKLRLLHDRYGMRGNESAEEFASKLVAGGYATDKNYKKTVLSVIKSV